MHPLIERHRARIRDLAARYGIDDVRVFGSMARDDADSDSEIDIDIDLLVTLPPGRIPLSISPWRAVTC